jgi:mannose-6-phosphate isomerase-like protein (cupin superfamily)
MADAATVQVIDTASLNRELPIVQGGGNSRVVIWPGDGAKYRSLQLLTLEPGAATIALRHPSDCVYYVISGSGAVHDITSGEQFAVSEGSMVHIDRGDEYTIAAGEQAMQLVGGPCPPDDALYASMTNGSLK